jgi:hypothetical protein
MGLTRPGPGATDDQTAAVVVDLADPLHGTYAEIAKEHGVSRGVVDALARKLKKMPALMRAVGEPAGKSRTKALYEHVAERVLLSIDDDAIKEAGLRDRVVAAATATDKALLLDGQPTEILSVPQMENLDSLCEMLLKEAKRRGQLVALNEDDQTVTMQRQIGVGEARDPSRDASAPSDEPR